MICLIDTNIILDFLLERQHQAEAEAILAACADRKISGYLSALSYGTISYMLTKTKYSSSEVRKACFNLINLLAYTAPSEKDLLTALNNQMEDFEDAVQAETARSIDAKYIVTRNIKHFVDSPVPAILPEDLAQHL